ncbi:recombinase family protein [Bacillus sp. RG28]|uniref:Recombinase family protein n=1 Tax=Gottfriedia endophytica TaxID=2820819 RepID=A0A940NQ91_9BACI|nr:recombinase family protein [Gottfriedia endophytica]MBP0725573.1 recombinase family protein [Gottfriedia endophytica]
MSYRPLNLDVYIYLRKSRKDQEQERKAISLGENYDTLERHRKRLLEIAKNESHNIIEIFEEVTTGENIIERPMMQQLLRNVESGKVDAVLVIDIDRLGRGDMLDSGLIDRSFRESDTLIITQTEVFDPSEESWELIFGVKSLLSRQELKAITRRMQNGRVDSIKEGKHIGKKPPFGYIRTNELKLVKDPETYWVVERIFEMMVNGFGRVRIAKELEKLGINPPDPNQPKRKVSTGWRPSTISEILKNEVYIGNLVWKRTRYIKRNGKYKRIDMPREEWIINEGTHEPIVAKELFKAANSIHSGRHTPKTKEGSGLVNPLAGLVSCQVCGHAMIYQLRKDRKIPILVCNYAGCRGIQRTVRFPLVQDRILQSLNIILKEIETKQSKKKNSQVQSMIESKLKAYELKKKELEELETQRNNAHDFLEKGIYSIEIFQERHKVISEKINSISDEIQALETEIESDKIKLKNVVEFVPKIKNVISAYNSTDDIETKNRLLKSVLEKATLLRTKDMIEPDDFQLQIYPKF